MPGSGFFRDQAENLGGLPFKPNIPSGHKKQKVQARRIEPVLLFYLTTNETFDSPEIHIDPSLASYIP
tara:strand:+ start:168157 stop:168360 length:204 start_codon:yes stop_codon:yes gene_type:complete